MQQARAVKAAIANGGLHPDMNRCRLGDAWCGLMKKAGAEPKIARERPEIQ